MNHEDELIKSIKYIYKVVHANPRIHRNVLRKELLKKGESKNKFSLALDYLVRTKKIVLEKENLYIAPQNITLSVLQKKNHYYLVVPESKKRYPVEENVAIGYKPGDLLDVIIEQVGDKKVVIVLGKSKKELKQEPEAKNKPELKKENLLLGRVVKISHDELVFIPNKKSIVPRQIPILNSKEEYASFQDKICIINLINKEAPLLGGNIVEVKGDAGNPIHEYDAIAESYGAIMDWNDEGLEDEINQIPSKVDYEQLEIVPESMAKFGQTGKVVDLRHLPFATVDPATCKDMDDAIYSTFNQNGDIECWTAVANVTKYVAPNSEIFKKYIRGGFTIYAPNKAYNILPTQLSTGICSLNPNEDRLAFVVKTVIDQETGKVKSSKIYDAIINSRKKYSYEQAQEVVDEMESSCFRDDLYYKTLMGEQLTSDEQVLMNYYAGQTIKKGFENRKMIRFVSNNEHEVVFDQDMTDVVDIKPIPHLYYHEVIEAFMITANEATAKYARDNNLDNIFRVHDSPNPKKVDRANEFFEVLGVNFEGDLSAEGTRTLIELIRDTANEEVINKFLIKMQSRAVYSDHLYGGRHNDNPTEWLGERISHYALQSPHYSHTTSPIRRVPDYITQFNILANIHKTKPLSANVIQKIVEIANDRQIEVDQAEKDFEDISSVMYCEKHIGEKLNGRITKIRYASPEEGYEDDIIVIVKNDEKGINAEIPLSQIIGRSSVGCELSRQKCAVYNARGNTILTLCKPVDFIIEKADRKSMIVVGRTNKELVSGAEIEPNTNKTQETRYGVMHKKEKNNRRKRMEAKKSYRHYDELENE